MRSQRFWRNSKGMTMMELLVVAGIGGIVGVMIASVQFMAFKTQNKVQAIDWLHTARLQAIRTIQNPGAWKQIVDRNPSLACVKNRADCANQGGLIRLYDRGGNVLEEFADPSNGSRGRSNNGQECSTFTASGDSTCPFRYEVRWRPLCRPNVGAETGCKYPQIEITGVLRYSPGAQRETIHPAMFGFRLAKAETGEQLGATCLSLKPLAPGATPNPTVTNCHFLEKRKCPPDQFLVGFNLDGSIICETGQTFVCPNGSVLSEVTSNGEAVCSPGCNNPNPGGRFPVFEPGGGN